MSAVVVGPRRDHQQRPHDRADAVAGVGHAEPVRAPDLGRAHEQRVEREVEPAEPQADEDDRGEEIGEAARQGHAGRANGHRRRATRDSTALPGKRRRVTQPSGTPSSAPRKCTLTTAAAAGSETWNLCENVTSSGPYSEAVAPKTMKVVVAPAKAGREKATSRAAASSGVGVHSTGGAGGSGRAGRLGRGRGEEGALAGALELVHLARGARRRARRRPRRPGRPTTTPSPGAATVGSVSTTTTVVVAGRARVGQRGGELVARGGHEHARPEARRVGREVDRQGRAVEPGRGRGSGTRCRSARPRPTR